MAIIYNPRLVMDGRSYYLPIPITQIRAKHSWKGKYHKIPLGTDIITGRVKGPIDITISGIICIDRSYIRLTELQLWESLYELEDQFAGGRWGYFSLVTNDLYPTAAFELCYAQSFSYSKPSGLVQYIHWSASIKALSPIVVLS